MPHIECLVLDSSTPEEDSILMSEAELAAALMHSQLQNGMYTGHHTKPVLVATVLGNHTGRLTHAHFDGKKGELILCQSRTLDFSGDVLSPDAWTMLRWIASQPVAETRHRVGSSSQTAGKDRDSADPVLQISASA